MIDSFIFLDINLAETFDVDVNYVELGRAVIYPTSQ